MSLTLGSCSKSGPMYSKTNINKTDDSNPVSWVLPPELATAKDRDIDADEGRHWKNDPKQLQNPCKREIGLVVGEKS